MRLVSTAAAVVVAVEMMTMMTIVMVIEMRLLLPPTMRAPLTAALTIANRVIVVNKRTVYFFKL